MISNFESNPNAISDEKINDAIETILKAKHLIIDKSLLEDALKDPTIEEKTKLSNIKRTTSLIKTDNKSQNPSKSLKR